jgi:hypothetical protein
VTIVYLNPFSRSNNMRHTHFALAGGVLLASLLAACGGGDDDPVPTPLDSLVTISAASNPAQAGVIGTYASTTTGLSDVEKENPLDAPQFCSFRFNSLAKAGAGATLLDGRVAYNVNQNLVNNFKVSVGGTTYGTGNTDNTVVDRTANTVTVTNKVLLSEVDGTSTVTVTARVPMKTGRPDGC